ncbi:MAG: CoA-binding protein [Dehalococcoidia bacterium]
MGIDVAAFDRIFKARTAAVIGDKQSSGYSWLNAMSAFKGSVYSVQVDEREIPGIEALGVPNYKSLLDIPGPVDFAIVAVPRKVAPMILEGLIAKNVGGATFYTSGFAETGTEEGIALQEALTERAREANFMLVGPNCMGVYVPNVGIRFHSGQYIGDDGQVGWIGQSGSHSMNFSLIGAQNGIKISKMVSFGNAIVLDSPDYLEYLGQDPDTKVIGMYLEGFKDGRRFFHVLRKVAAEKPVVIWKGGQTGDGARAVVSHTASLATNTSVWNALVKQCDAITVDSMEEMVDVIKALLYVKPSTGTRMGIMALTGGPSVVSADAFAKAGLQVGLLGDESYRELSTFFTVIGASYKNPLDISSNLPKQDIMPRLLEILERDQKVDAITMELSTSILDRREMGDKYFDNLMKHLTEHREKSKKPFFTTVQAINQEAEAIKLRGRLMEKGIPSFPSFDRSANAYKKVVDYYRFRQG